MEHPGSGEGYGDFFTGGQGVNDSLENFDFENNEVLSKTDFDDIKDNYDKKIVAAKHSGTI